MNLLECVKSGLFYMDGGTGSYLQAKGLKPGELPELWNITHPDVITELGKSYFEAGSHMICTNTFGVNRIKFNGENGTPSVFELVTKVDTFEQIYNHGEMQFLQIIKENWNYMLGLIRIELLKMVLKNIKQYQVIAPQNKIKIML